MINFWNTIFEIHVIYAEIPFSKLSLFVIVLFTKWAEKGKAVNFKTYRGGPSIIMFGGRIPGCIIPRGGIPPIGGPMGGPPILGGPIMACGGIPGGGPIPEKIFKIVLVRKPER